MIIVIISIAIILFYGFIKLIQMNKYTAMFVINTFILLIGCYNKDTAIVALIICIIIDIIFIVFIPNDKWNLKSNIDINKKHMHQMSKEEQEYDDWGFIDFNQK